ncbi:serine/threonine protein kinase [Paraburkholderia domus]|uniref:serine/threonine protein kinase n=1 Tax=Paraburkholderia domus TaxID=2793075 RepID=UPI0019138600|nr:serine/threonine protein kinase [Paraburkholderia domus]MBK5118306.1 protein kinase [Burkholderia sp. R-69980]MBK5179819.1 protein kinase [Burkholderia sp. R-69749]CAE6769874.1 Serine/threonine-protein kinase PknD [Paraburkholderia domus]CAE6871284.1 Serine/threonine-protein kinase PknD [Paraburkholderia domus]
MASLAHVIRDYQNGELSRDEFVAQLDSTLTTEGLGPTQLLEMLGAAHRKAPLPDDLYAEVRRRIEQLRVSNVAAGGEETGIQTNVEIPSVRSASGANTSSSAGAANASAAAGHDQIKGTGDTLNNRFVLEECLGVGGMGTVYKALDLRKLEASDRKPYLAIKVLNLQFRGNPNSLVALQREARKAQVLAHRNIIAVYDFDRDGPIVYLTMEYLTGKPLSQLLRTPGYKGMPVRAALPIVRGMCNALAYAHEHGFVHCDFKPANVFLTTNAEVKVIDFGIARVFQRPEEESDATVFDPGSLGALTPAYASPEMIEHREPDPRDDIYALGCITYELLTGHHPFDRLSATQARNADFKPQRPPNLDAKQWRALRAALSFDRNTRMPSVVRFIAEFDNEARAEKSGTLVKAGFAGFAVVCAAAVGVFALRSAPNRQSGAQPAAAVSEASPEQGASAAALVTAATAASAPEPPSTAASTAAPLGASTPAQAPAPPAPKPALSLAAVAPVLAQVPCSALSASAQDHALTVRGYVSQRYGSVRLKDTLAALPGVDTLALQVEPLADDKCDTIKALAPYWTRNWQAGHVASLHVRPPGGLLSEGDPLVVDVTTPAYDSYVNLDYYQLDGSVVHMVPSPRAKDNQAPPHYAATIGSAGDWIISKPFGSEMVVLLITPVQLFDKPRPESESRADYLRALDTRLAQIAGKYGQDHIVADFAPITTKPRTP